MHTTLQATERTEFRNSSLTKIRHEGNIPAVLYGNGVESVAISVNGPEFLKTMRDVGRNGVFPLELNGKKMKVMLNDYQAEPIKNKVLHCDFIAVDMSKEVTADVRIHLVGDASGVRDGGVLQQSLHEVSVSATPANIPASVEIDISNLQVGETMTVGDIPQSSKYTILQELDQSVVSITPPQTEEEINSGEEQESGTPENEEGRETSASQE